MADYLFDWQQGELRTVDQRELPSRTRELRITTVAELIEAVRTLAIRGAPAIGIAAAFGVAISARANTVAGVLDVDRVAADAALISAARPTAVNAEWGVRRAMAQLADGADAVLAEARAMLIEDGDTNRAAATHAADLVESWCPGRPLRILTHCNTGQLATGSFGTALGAIRVLADRGRVGEVFVDETRPLLQGARLTAWELRRAGVPYRIIADSAAAWTMAARGIDCVVVGADRIAANGDVANKIGTYSLAVAARHHGIPFVVVAPESTRDTTVATGQDIPIEERDAVEITHVSDFQVAPAGSPAFNPAFDVTPADLITSVVTELGPGAQVPKPLGQTGDAESELVVMAAALYRRGWLPGTSGNLSVRRGDQAVITGSGLAKSELSARDMVTVRIVDSAPVAATMRRPSAETAIHTAVYRATECGAVVHAHSPYATAVAIRFGRPDETAVVTLGHYELLKGFGLADPASVDLPVFPNWPDVALVGADVQKYLGAVAGTPPVLLIAGHGATTWGATLGQARDRLECLEALCRLVITTGRLDTWVA